MGGMRNSTSRQTPFQGTVGGVLSISWAGPEFTQRDQLPQQSPLKTLTRCYAGVMQRKPQYRYEPMTLIDLDYHCVTAVAVWCLACDRKNSIPAALLIAKLGSDFPVPAVAKRTRCQECGGRGDESRPDWPAVRCGFR